VLKREVECARPLRLQTRRTASKLPHDQKCDRCGSRCSCAPVLDCCTVLRFMCPSDTYINDAGPYEQTIKPRFCTPGVFGRPIYLFCTFSFSMSRAPLCGWGAPPSLCGGRGPVARPSPCAAGLSALLRSAPPTFGEGVSGICYAVLRSSLACARVSLRLPRAPLPALSCLRFLGSTA
jgi:hypothetical protein